MKITSRLVKMETRLGSLERKGEEILSRSDPKLDTAQTKVYMGPDDLVGMIKLINSSVVGYLFLFPVFYVAQYLRKIESHKDGISKLWQRISILFACILILGGTMGFSFHAALCFFLIPFSIFFLLIALFNKKGDFVYPMAFLQGVSVYLFTRLFSLDDRSVPFLGSLVVLIWFFMARRWKEREEIALSLYRSGYWAVSFFSYEVLNIFLQGVVDKDPGLVWLVIPLLIFTFYVWVRHFETRELYLQYLAIAILTVAYVLAIFAIPYLPLRYMGSYVVVLAMILTYIGVHYQESWGYAVVQPLFRLGVVLALTSFFFSFWDVTVFSLNIVLYSVLYFEAYFWIVLPSSDESEEELGWTLRDVFFALAILGSVVFTFVYFFFDRPCTYGTIIASLGFGYHFIRAGLRRGGGVLLKNRNEWFYASAFFFSLGFFSLMGLLVPLVGIQSLLLSVFPVVIFLASGLYFGKKANGTERTSLNESSYLFVIIALVWALSQKRASLLVSFGLILLFGIAYGGFNIKAKDKALWYSFSFLSVFLSYTSLRYLPYQEVLGFYMIPLGWIFLFLAIYLKWINHVLKDACHLTWFLFFLASIHALMPELRLASLGFTLWSLALLITSVITTKEKDGEVERKTQGEIDLEPGAPAPWRA